MRILFTKCSVQKDKKTVLFVKYISKNICYHTDRTAKNKEGLGLNSIDLNKITAQFNICTTIEPYGDGHINDTFVANMQPRYILQRINNEVFKNPEQVMNNIVLVTEHVAKKIKQAGQNRASLKVIYTLDGKPFYKSEDGSYFRMYEFIENAVSYSKADSPDVFYNAAKGFGEFFELLSDFDASSLYETIEKFHHTPTRFDNFAKAVQADKLGRAETAKREIDGFLSRKAMTSVVTDAIDAGDVPIRVTHNDTKLNNIMLDEKTGEPVCVIDLDTVMPGSILYDFGDSIRFGASSAAEDEHDLDNVYCDLELFEAFTKGFLEATGKFLTPKEIELLPFSARLLTYECGMRFLTDYLEGDTYFKIHYDAQNLYRARTQLKLVEDMERKEAEMKKIVAKYA